MGHWVTAECEIVEDLGDAQYRLSTRVVNDVSVLIDGEAVVLIDELPEEGTDERAWPPPRRKQ